jgi:hypothetical protein
MVFFPKELSDLYNAEVPDPFPQEQSLLFLLSLSLSLP